MANIPSRDQYDLSIVIPSHGRKAALECLLNSLGACVTHLDFKIQTLVVDSSPNAFDAAQVFCRDQISLQVLTTKARGVNVKRNLGIDHTEAPIALFLDDDCEIISTELLRGHIEAHQRHRELIIGGVYQNEYSTKVSEAYAIIYSNWIENSELGSRLVGGNMSVKLDSGVWLRFDESLIFGGTERELIFRMMSRGHTSLLKKNLVLFHNVSVRLTDFLKKAFCQGQTEAILWQRYSKQLQCEFDGFSCRRLELNLIQKFLVELYQVFFEAGYFAGRFSDRPKYGWIFILKSLMSYLFSWDQNRVSLEGPNILRPALTHNLQPKVIKTKTWNRSWRYVVPLTNLMSSIRHIVFVGIKDFFWKVVWPLSLLFQRVAKSVVWRTTWRFFWPVGQFFVIRSKTLYWKVLWPVGQFFVMRAKALYWKVLWPVGQFFAIKAKTLYWKIFWPAGQFMLSKIKMSYWKVLCPLGYFSVNKSRMMYWKIFWPFSQFFVNGTKFIYWKAVWPTKEFVWKTLRNLYWKLAYPTYGYVVSKTWVVRHIPRQISFYFMTIYWKVRGPLFFGILKPYFFLRYQYHKRILKQRHE